MKRLLDLCGALLLLAILSPLLLVLALLVRVKLGSPVLFRQRRPGRGGRIFTLVKFRSMRDVRGRDGLLLSDAERLTPFGVKLRASSLDELPELWNVVRGEMSLVGPRPLLVEYLDRYTPEEARRHEVRPGLTGWAQIHGRNATTWDERLKLDVWYVDHHCVALDLRILWRTIALVCSRDGISAPGEATMAPLRPKNSRDAKS
jgi:lipopolysaccharide/colanic/teichoic acid biosynthesis glycosyltransferase